MANGKQTARSQSYKNYKKKQATRVQKNANIQKESEIETKKVLEEEKKAASVKKVTTAKKVEGTKANKTTTQTKKASASTTKKATGTAQTKKKTTQTRVQKNANIQKVSEVATKKVLEEEKKTKKVKSEEKPTKKEEKLDYTKEYKVVDSNAGKAKDSSVIPMPFALKDEFNKTKVEKEENKKKELEVELVESKTQVIPVQEDINEIISDDVKASEIEEEIKEDKVEDKFKDLDLTDTQVISKKQMDEVLERVNEKEIEKKIEKPKEEVKKTKIKKRFVLKTKYKAIISMIFIFLSVWLILSINSLGVVPDKYFGLSIIVIGLLDLIGTVCLFIKKIWTKVFTVILYFVVALFSIIGIKFIGDTNEFLDNSFDNAETKNVMKYYIVSKNKYNEDELKGIEIYYSKYIIYLDKVLDYNDKNNKYNLIEDEIIDDVIKKDVFLIDSSNWEMLVTDECVIKAEDFNMLYEFEIEYDLNDDPYAIPTTTNVIETTNGTNTITTTTTTVMPPTTLPAIPTTNDYFNVYIGGVDFSGYRMDFNMIATINKKTKQVLLTNIPRDYYLYVPQRGVYSTLTRMSQYGIDYNVKSLEYAFGIKIDYSVKVKTVGLVELVDSVGGIDFCSSFDFTTDHAKVIGTYDDSLGEKVQVHKGCQFVDGITALTIARERKAYGNNDKIRQQKCTEILMAVLKRMKEPENIGRYNEVLNAVGNMYTTNLSRSVVTAAAKDYLNGGWSIKTQLADGSWARQTNGLDGRNIPTVSPKESNLEKVREAINAMK